jgi:ABC-2 type transport system permease protein
MPPLLLIAEREFRAYVATVSFWVALAIGPIAIVLAFAGVTLASKPSPPIVVSVAATDPATAQSALTAVSDAARLEGRSLRVSAGQNVGPRLLVSRTGGAATVRFDGAFPLSPSGRALVAATLERDALRRDASARMAPVPWRLSDTAERRVYDGGPTARFALVMMLWLTLTGSLGMLLNAVVRERSSRALETLLASASRMEIVLGKLTGVGAVSLLVIGAWLGTAAAAAPFTPAAAGPGAAVLSQLGDPAALVRAALIYVVAYLFYGLLTIALGAGARDSAQAQNLSRPMFAILLAAFFASLASVAGAAGGLSWLAWAPPFTPFILLLRGPGAIGGNEVLAIGLTLAGAALCARAAAVRMQVGTHCRRSALA